MANAMEKTADALVVVGALNWGLGLFGGFNLVTAITNMIGGTIAATIIYLLIGLAGLNVGYRLYFKK